MTNDEFILGLIEVNVQKGYLIPDKHSGTQFVDRGMFTFLYGGEIIKLERHVTSFSDNCYFFSTYDNEKTYKISKGTYDKARNYFNLSKYDKLKDKLKKDIRKIKLDVINDK